jgi:hypothetical protein
VGVPRLVVARRSGSLAPALQEGLAGVAVDVDQGLSARSAHRAGAAADGGDIHAARAGRAASGGLAGGARVFHAAGIRLAEEAIRCARTERSAHRGSDLRAAFWWHLEFARALSRGRSGRRLFRVAPRCRAHLPRRARADGRGAVGAAFEARGPGDALAAQEGPLAGRAAVGAGRAGRAGTGDADGAPARTARPRGRAWAGGESADQATRAAHGHRGPRGVQPACQYGGGGWGPGGAGAPAALLCQARAEPRAAAGNAGRSVRL